MRTSLPAPRAHGRGPTNDIVWGKKCHQRPNDGNQEQHARGLGARVGD